MSDDIKTFKSIEKLLKSINREQTDYRDTLRDNEALLDSILNISQKTAEQNLATSRQELEALKQRHQAIMDNEQRTADEFIEATKLNDMIKEKTESLAKDTVAVKENAKALAQQNASIRTTLGRFKQLTTVYERHEEVNSDLIFRMKDFFLTMGTVRGGIAMSLVALTGLVDSFISLAFSADESSKALARQTGITVEFGDKLAVSRDEVTRFGVSLDDQSKSFQALRSTFTDFSLSNEDLQVKLTNSTAVLNQLGIANQDLAAGFQNTTKFFGQTAEAALSTASDLADFSTIIGESPSKIASDFASVGTSIAKLGSDGPRAFKDLAVAAKITGIEIGRLVQITDKFDTFDGAAAQAGKLNAALGGNFVNAMDLMMATDPIERFEMLRDSILNTGMTFDDMSYFQRKFFTEAAGLNDVGELAKLMSGDFTDLAGATQMSSADFAKQAERAKEVQNVQESLQASLRSLITVSAPLVELFREFTVALEDNREDIKKVADIAKMLAENSLIPLLKVMAEFPKTTLAAGVAFGAFRGAIMKGSASMLGIELGGKGKGGFNLFGKILGGFSKKGATQAAVGQMKMAGGAMQPLSDAATQLAENGEDAAGAIEAMGEASGDAASNLSKMVKPILAIGASIAMAAFGVSFLVKAFSELTGDQIIGAVGGIAALGIALAVFAKIAFAAAAPTGVLALAVLSIGAAVGIAAVGMSYLVESFKGLETTFDTITGISVFLAVFTSSAILLGLAGPAAAGGIVVLAGALALLSLSFGSLGEKMTPFNTFVTGLATLTENVSNLGLVKAEIEAIANAMEKIPTGAGMSINAVAGAAANFSAAPANITYQPKQTIQLEINGKQFNTYIKNVIGESVQEYMRQQK
jgi:hypothetical protein|tara:strand:- start:6144 stop:8750 length:2607 start_codon:yes stop_codon:yes gene_type:complete